MPKNPLYKGTFLSPRGGSRGSIGAPLRGVKTPYKGGYRGGSRVHIEGGLGGV